MKFSNVPSWLLATTMGSPVLAAAPSGRLRGGNSHPSSENRDAAAAVAVVPSYDVHHRGAARHDLASPNAAECIIEVVALLEIAPGTVPHPIRMDCVMDAADANGRSNQVRSISGSPGQMASLRRMFEEGDIVPGRSALRLDGGMASLDGGDVGVGDRELVLGAGFDPKSRVIGNKGRNDGPPHNGGGLGSAAGGLFGGRRDLATVTGDKPMLVVKVADANGLARSEPPSEISDDVFGTDGDPVNLRSQLNGCSMGKMNVVAGDNGSGSIDQSSYAAAGVVNVTIPIDLTTASNGEVRNAVTDAVQELLGVTLPGPYQQVLYVLEGCYADCGWAAYAYINSWNSVYQGGYYKSVGVLVHELGHNFNLAHSGGLDGASYSDHTGMMGNPLYSDDVGRMCYNAAKNWQIGWYDDRKLLLNPLDQASDWSRSVTMVGIADYLDNPSGHDVVIKIESNTPQDYFLGFNRASGVNADNDQADDMVTVIQVTNNNGEGYAQSYLKATLGQDQAYTIPGLGGSGTNVILEVTGIDLSTSPATATILFATDRVPTSSPTPRPPQCEGSDPASCGCDSVNQDDYRGDISATAGGYPCQGWGSQTPHPHSRTPENYPGMGLEGNHNHCRNPDNEPGGAWCYTSDPGVRWQYCDVPSCVATGTPTGGPTAPVPTKSPTLLPTNAPTNTQTPQPTNKPTTSPSGSPTPEPSTAQPTNNPTPNLTSSGACEGSDPATCGCDSVNQQDYRGTSSATAGGLACQSWESQSPHSHSRTPGNYPDKGLEGNHNHCRNPDNEPNGAWCYTTDPGVRWQYCDVPSCVAPSEPTVQPTPSPTDGPTTRSPTDQPTRQPTVGPMSDPSNQPTAKPTTSSPTKQPTDKPSNSPTGTPTDHPSDVPTAQPTKKPTEQPTNAPTDQPTNAPTLSPIILPVCSTPELTSLESLTSDRRTAFQNANLPTITGGTSSASPASSTSCQTDLSKQKVLMIGIDGLRADVVGMTPLPNIRRLQAMGTYSFWANVQSSASAVSGPGWTSMFTGVEPTKHLVDGNGDLNDIAYPTVFKMAKENFGMKIAASVSWSPLITDIINHEDTTTLDASFLAPSDGDMAAKAEEWILSEQYDFVFVDFDGPDAAGHSSGFDGYATTYQNRVITTDALIGKLLDAVLSTSTGEEWLIVLTSDHGGEGTVHGPSDAYNRKIPFMVASNSPRVHVGYMPLEDPGSQMDVLPTIMHFLGGEVPAGLDGQVFGFSDYTRTAPPPPRTCIPDPENCGCESSKHADYRGTIAVTASGKPCQAWDSQTPHVHNNTPGNKPNSGLDSNYCRNPDGEPGAWCYTTDPNSRWELCSVPTCDTT